MLCKNCGNTLNPDSKFCPLCGTPAMQNSLQQSEYVQPQFADTAPPAYEPNHAAAFPTEYPVQYFDPTPPPKKSKKKALTVIICIILALAIVAGSVAVALRVNPSTAITLAATNTIFHSSELDITLSMDYESGTKITMNLSAVIGDDIESTTIEAKLTNQSDEFGSTKHRIKIKEGEVFVDGENMGEIDEYLEEAEDLLNEYTPEKIDLAEEINKILNKKLSSKAIEKAFDNIIAPTIENILEEEEDIEIDIPDLDNLLGRVYKISKAAAKGNLRYEKVKSDLPGTTYEIVIDDNAEYSRALLEAAFEDDFVNEVLDQVSDDFDKDEVIDNAVESAEQNEENGVTSITTLTIKSNRLTNIKIENPYITYEIEINSKR